MPAGRPTKYSAEVCEQATKLYLLGLSDEKVADVLCVSLATLYNWRESHPEFLEATMDGKERADAEIAKAMYHRARGYSHPAVKIMAVGKEIVREEYIEHYPPDTQAAVTWLERRDPERWRKRDADEGDEGSVEFEPDDELIRKEVEGNIAFVKAAGLKFQ